MSNYIYYSINSGAKVAGSVSNADFNIDLPTPVTGIKDVNLAALSLPNIFQRAVISVGVNDTVDFKIGADDFSAVIPPGSYTGTTLAAAVQAEMIAVGGAGFTATYSDSHIMIEYSGNFSLLWASGTNAAISAANVLGFAAVDLENAASYTSDGGILLSPSSVFIGCDTLAINVRQTAGDAPINFAWEVPIIVPFGSVQKYEPISDTILAVRKPGIFQSLHITLVDASGEPIALGNTNWSLSLQFSTP